LRDVVLGESRRFLTRIGTMNLRSNGVPASASAGTMRSNVGQASRLPRSDASPSEQFVALFTDLLVKKYQVARAKQYTRRLGRRFVCPAFNPMVTAQPVWRRAAA